MSMVDARGEMAVFVRSVESGSFSSAAQDLGLTPSAVSKAITRLETRLQVRLLHRSTRRLAPTAEGQAFYSSCIQILRDIAEAESALARERQEPQGMLRVNCGLSFGQDALVPAIPEFLNRYPGIRVELALTDAIVDLARDGADIAIRIGGSTGRGEQALRICDLQRVICAAPAYIRLHGKPRHPADLARHNCLYVTGAPELRRWPFRTTKGPVVVEVDGNATANNARTILDFALRGVGIARLIDLIVEEPIRRGRLVRLLDDTHQVEPVPLQAIYATSRYPMQRVGAMLDFLVEKFGAAPWRQPARG